MYQHMWLNQETKPHLRQQKRKTPFSPFGFFFRQLLLRLLYRFLRFKSVWRLRFFAILGSRCCRLRLLSFCFCLILARVCLGWKHLLYYAFVFFIATARYRKIVSCHYLQVDIHSMSMKRILLYLSTGNSSLTFVTWW